LYRNLKNISNQIEITEGTVFEGIVRNDFTINSVNCPQIVRIKTTVHQYDGSNNSVYSNTFLEIQ